MKPLTAAGIGLLMAAIVLGSFFRPALQALSYPLVLLSLGLSALAGLSFGISRLNLKHGYAIACALILVGGGIVTSTAVIFYTMGSMGVANVTQGTTYGFNCFYADSTNSSHANLVEFSISAQN